MRVGEESKGERRGMELGVRESNRVGMGVRRWGRERLEREVGLG